MWSTAGSMSSVYHHSTLTHSMNLMNVIPGYYKRNRHFQCCIEMKLLMI